MWIARIMGGLTGLFIGYIRGYANGLFRSGFMSGLYGTGAILIIVFIVRSLPTGTRSGISALRQIDKSIEESAYDMGANSARVFMTVTLPLIKDSFFSGLVTAFVRSITAIGYPKIYFPLLHHSLNILKNRQINASFPFHRRESGIDKPLSARTNDKSPSS